MTNGKFFIASEDDIKKGGTTDIYFVHTQKVLELSNLDSKIVYAEFTAGSLPREWEWGVYCGVEEALRLLEGLPVDVYSLPEGTVFHPRDLHGIRTPVMAIEGPYGRFCVYETPCLGFICQSTGIATMAARVRKRARDKRLISFGIRRMHPVLSPMIDRAAYIGGFDGVSSLTGARTIGLTPVGTMPHGLIIVFGDQREAWKAFHQHIAPEVARIAIVDTIYDEKPEAIMACETLGQDLDGVRLDTPGSRRGSFEDIIKEVRWELDLRGYKNVKLFVSGSIDEHNIESLIEAGADGFGVGTSISNAPTVDFAMDIVEMDGESVAKRGKFGGKKRVYRCTECVDDIITPWDETAPECGQCGTTRTSILEKYIDHGKIIKELPSPEEIRKYVLRQLKKIKL